MEASSAEAAQAVASLQVNTDIDQFGDLFNVTSCSEPSFTLIDSNNWETLKPLKVK